MGKKFKLRLLIAASRQSQCHKCRVTLIKKEKIWKDSGLNSKLSAAHIVGCFGFEIEARGWVWQTPICNRRCLTNIDYMCTIIKKAFYHFLFFFQVHTAYKPRIALGSTRNIGEKFVTYPLKDSAPFAYFKQHTTVNYWLKKEGIACMFLCSSMLVRFATLTSHFKFSLFDLFYN